MGHNNGIVKSNGYKKKGHYSKSSILVDSIIIPGLWRRLQKVTIFDDYSTLNVNLPVQKQFKIYYHAIY